MPKSRLAAVVWILGLGVAGGQALALCTRYFQPGLNADYLYAQLFAEDVLAGRYPLSGWTLASAPYFFPDLTAALGLLMLGGPGPILPAYVVLYYLALAVVAGWSLQRATQAGWAAWLGGVLLVNGLLAWQPVTDHAQYLWLLATPNFHGGTILLGLVVFALWAGAAETRPSHPRLAGMVFFLGTISDTLFLTQFALPLGLALWAQADWDWRRPRVRAYATLLAVALALVGLVRLGLAFGGWFNFSKVVRYAPTPAAIAGSVADFARDVRVTFLPGAWGFLLLAAVALTAVGVLWSRGRRQNGLSPSRPATLMALAGLAATTLLPIVTVYWRSAPHVRYILPWLVLPAWLALVWVLPRIRHWAEGGRPLAILGLVLAGAGAAAGLQIRLAALRWPYLEQQARFDEFIRSRGLRYGLGDYWHAQEISTLTRAPARLFPLRPTGRASFWNNNAFWFYTVGEDGSLEVPAYTFIVTNGLDEAALLARFGEPASRERVGELTCWLYVAADASRLTRSMEEEVHGFLRGRPGEERIVARP